MEREQMDISDTGWMEQGACRDYPPNVFFPSDSIGVAAAKKICAGCVVIDVCKEYALSNHIENGVWGGMSERDHRRIRKQRRLGK